MCELLSYKHLKQFKMTPIGNIDVDMWVYIMGLHVELGLHVLEELYFQNWSLTDLDIVLISVQF